MTAGTVRRWLWSAAAVLVVAVVVSLHRRLPGVEETEGAQRRFLSGQRCKVVNARLDLDPRFLRLQGSVTAMVQGADVDEELHFLLHHALEVDSVTVDGVRYVERAAAGSAFFAESRDRRRYSPDPELDFSLPNAELHEVTISFEGSACAVSSLEGPLPLLLRPTDLALPYLSVECEGIELDLSIPESLGLLAGGDTSETMAAQPGMKSFRVLATGPRAPALAVGDFRFHDWRSGAASVRLASHGDLGLSEAEWWRIRLKIEELIGPRVPAALDFLVSDTAEGATAVEPALWQVGEEQLRANLVLAQVRAAIAAAAPEDPLSRLPEALSVLPEITAYWVLNGAPSVDARALRRHLRDHVDPARRRWLEGWMAVSEVELTLAKESLRAQLRAQDTAPRLFDRRDLESTFEWAATPGGVQLTFQSIEITEVGRTFDLDASVRVRPPPPAGVSPPLHCVAVLSHGVQSGSAQVPQELLELEVEWKQGHGQIRKQRLRWPVRRLVLDAAETFPDADRTDNVSLPDHPLEPALFAVSEAEDLLALVPFRRARSGGDPYGLYVYEMAPQGLGFLRWIEVDGEVVETLRWVPGSRSLLVGGTRRGRPFEALVDLEDGHWRDFADPVDVDPTGERLLLNRRQAPGRWRHGRYDLRTQRERPFLNEVPGRLRWLDEGRLLRGAVAAGRTRVFDAEGNVRAELPFEDREIRGVKADDLGFTFVVENAGGSVLLQQRTDDASRAVPFHLYQSPGRILSYYRVANSPDFWVFEERADGFAIVMDGRSRPLLVQGKRRPIAQMPTATGALLALPSSDPELEELSFLSYHARDGETGPTLLCTEAFLDVPLQAAREGRSLYYLRALEGEPAELGARYRTRVLVRYDFLWQREETVFDGRILP